MISFNYIQPTEEQIKSMQEFRTAFAELFAKVLKEVPNSRGKSIALTEIEQAAMWVNKAITNNSDIPRD